jgi:hypothetical protein
MCPKARRAFWPLDADVVEKHGEIVLLSFHFTGVALDDALDRMGRINP